MSKKNINIESKMPDRADNRQNLIKDSKNIWQKILRYFTKKSTYKKMGYGLLFAFLFWLSFFGFVLQELGQDSIKDSINLSKNFMQDSMQINTQSIESKTQNLSKKYLNIFSISQYIISLLLVLFGIYFLKKYSIIESKKNVFFKARYFVKNKKDSKKNTHEITTQNITKNIEIIESKSPQNNNKDISIQAWFENKDSIFYAYFIGVICCIILFSILHKNEYFLCSLGYLLSIMIFVFLPRKYRFYFGFFVGAIGFYWIPFSFRFEGLSAYIPLGVLGIGLIYGIIFYFLMYFNNALFRIITALCLYFIAPLGFDWLNIAYFSAYSVFGTGSLFALLLAAGCLKGRVYAISFLLILFSFDYNFTREDSKLNADIVETHYAQDMRWVMQSRNQIVADNFNAIERAIAANYDMVILPESSFPFALNTDTQMYQRLLDLSTKIVIVAGALRVQNKDSLGGVSNDFINLDSIKSSDDFSMESSQNIFEKSLINTPSKERGYYNSIYIFAFGKSMLADKIELVPFGERLPFELLEPIYQHFGLNFGFKKGEKILSFEFKGLKIAIANCFEGTMSLPYESGAKYVIMLSNNAWFAPSTQSYMQKMIIKYYARDYKAFVYHSTNYSPKALITPNNG